MSTALCDMAKAASAAVRRLGGRDGHLERVLPREERVESFSGESFAYVQARCHAVLGQTSC